MQNAVENGGEKLNNVLKKSNMSLRKLEMISKNDSMGFKQLCTELGMTTTEVTNLIKAGTNLEDFAKVSGMTIEQFKKAWKEDAAGALTAFIKGLGDAEDKGESAISMLTDMGLTEVRLRDSLLRAANAGNLFNNAIQTGTKAWEENTALANEANKRYATLQSKIKIAVNKLKDLTITVGNKLMPTIDKGIQRIDKCAKWVEKLSDEDVELIVNIGKTVIAIGPLIKIFEKLTSAGGTTAKAIGTFVQAIGVMKGKTKSTSDSVNTMAKVMNNLISPTGLMTATVLAGAAALMYYNKTINEISKESEEYAKSILDTKQQVNDYNKSIDDGAGTELAHINRISKLKNELGKIVDENGNVKRGYEERVNFILNELNSALGTEYKMNGNIIESYGNLCDSIDDTIKKKKAEIILNASSKKWEEANEKQSKAIIEQNNALHKLEDTASKYGTTVDGLSNKIQELEKKENEWKKERQTSVTPGVMMYAASEEEKIKKQIEEIQNYMDAYKNATDIVQVYTDNIKQYDEDMTNYIEGNYEKLYSKQKKSRNDYLNSSLKDIKKSLNSEKRQYIDYAATVTTTGNELAKERKKQAEDNISTLGNELRKRTITVGLLGQEEIDAWKTLASASKDVYEQNLIKLPLITAKNIQEATGVLVDQTPGAVTIAQTMSQRVVEQFDKDEQFRAKALENLQGFLNGLSDENLKNFLQQAGVEDVDKVIQGIRSGNLAEEEGKNILSKLNNGLQNKSFSEILFSTARQLAAGLSKLLTVTATVKDGKGTGKKSLLSFLPGHKNGLDYVPKDDYVARLHKGERVLTAQENKEYTNAEETSRNKLNSAYVGNEMSYIAEKLIQSNTRLEQLLTKLIEISDKPLVLDTGELVSATAEKYDVAFAKIKSKKERGG